MAQPSVIKKHSDSLCKYLILFSKKPAPHIEWVFSNVEKEHIRIDLLDHLEETKLISEAEVFLGEKEKVSARLIAFRLPDEAVEQRIRKMRRALQKKKKNSIIGILKICTMVNLHYKYC